MPPDSSLSATMPDGPPRTPGLLAVYADRWRLLRALCLLLVVTGFVLRLVLYAVFHEGGFAPGTLLACTLLGLVRDALAAPLVLGPLALLLVLVRCGWLARPRPRAVALAAAGALVVFGALVEYFFFEEFDARFNNIAIDYLLFPDEVAGNLWQSYDIPLHVGAALAAGCAFAWLSRGALREARFAPLSWRARAVALPLVLASQALAFGGLWLLPRELGEDRVANEIAANGLVELVHSAWSADLPFPLYYRTVDEQETRAARVLGAPVTDGAAPSLQRHFATTTGATAPRQIVIVLEESLGSDFVKALGGRYDCAPELEKNFANGLLLSNLIANGNRTVRGLEGVLCSFVPLPGYALLQRGKSENVATIARVLSARGYQTAFYYGGSGLFDHMQSFVEHNGWQELHDEAEFDDGLFRTAWGVADEYVFDALLARQERARAEGQTLFATLLSVSNHKPYDFPRERYALPAELKGRPAATRYADACIGGYLDGLRERGLDAETLVLIVGDHGARVYGAEEIPTHSYRIPALFVTPDARWRGQRLERLCSQVDLLPTLLDLAGIECDAPFFGQSVLSLPPDGGRAFVHHNRDVGMLTDRALVVLGLQKTISFYTRSGRESDAFTRLTEGAATPELRALADDASAVFGTAFELYENRRFRLPGDLEPPSPPGVARKLGETHAGVF